jgi:hypothetical protein
MADGDACRSNVVFAPAWFRVASSVGAWVAGAMPEMGRAALAGGSMNEPNSSNMLFGALVARADAPHARAATAAAQAPRSHRTACVVAAAALLSILWVLALA